MSDFTKKVAILQSNYIPWKGYFDLLNQADDFIFYDEVQYTSGDWRNRNRIKTAQGIPWLTIPVHQGKLSQKIRETPVADPSWGARHWRKLMQAYARAPYFELYRADLEKLYQCVHSKWLSEINQLFIQTINDWLGIQTRLHVSDDFEKRTSTDRTARLVQLVQALGGTEYIVGPAAAAYLDPAQFAEAGISLTWMSYEGYPEYRQLHGSFEHRLSVLDLLLNEGPEAPRYMLSFPDRIAL
ncbi:WbqC family protein [Hymenobacter sp. YC55]|uniref:WbqC family protein n=1 Tax=Hymenobacter sp. YC55 TaxID=3034019 RepID=UPI0023F8FABF|nr:WbqC family protein [Hymenobacter sp. YC55]MDF7810201.1 WbqC family protein [Hymenobacter sp. YC55]